MVWGSFKGVSGSFSMPEILKVSFKLDALCSSSESTRELCELCVLCALSAVHDSSGKSRSFGSKFVAISLSFSAVKLSSKPSIDNRLFTEFLDDVITLPALQVPRGERRRALRGVSVARVVVFWGWVWNNWWEPLRGVCLLGVTCSDGSVT